MKQTVLLLCITSAVCMTGCGLHQSAAAPASDNTDVIDIAAEVTEIAAEPALYKEEGMAGLYWTDEDLPVSARTEAEYYRPDTAEIRVTVTNRTDEDFCFPASAFKLYQMQNGQELDFPYTENGGTFDDDAQIAPPHGTAVFTAKIAEHYGVLPEGVFTVHIGSLTTGFVISANAEQLNAPDQAAAVALTMEQTEYPAETEQITVLLTNTGSETVSVNFGDFGLEHTTAEYASYAPFDRAPVEHFADIRGVELEPGKAYPWTVSFADFGGTEPEPGAYALIYVGQRADFIINEAPAD